jgi:hypothetical protein
MMRLQPRYFAAITPASPTGPPPNTAMVLPARQSIERSTAPAPVCKPQPSGPSRARSSPASTFTTLRRSAMAWLAKEDWPKKAPAIGAVPSCSGLVPSGRAPA